MDYKNRIYITKIDRMEVKEGKKYQWIKGDYFGDLEVVQALENGKAKFESNRVLKLEVFEEFMKAIDSDQDITMIQKAGAAISNAPSAAPSAAPTIQQQTTSENDLLITNSKIVDAINSSKKSKVLNLKTKVKYLDPALYEFLKDAHDNFDEVYREMIIQQVSEELKGQIDEFLTNVYTKD